MTMAPRSGASRWLGLCLILSAAVWPATADTLIVNPGVGITSLSQNEARLYMTMRINQWPNGVPVRVFVLPDNERLHQRVVKGILGLYPYQLRRAWDRQLFSGTGQAPVTVGSEKELIERVASTPGAVGYADSEALDPAVRTLEVR